MTKEYKLQVMVPQSNDMSYVDSFYWNTVRKSMDLAYLQGQADIMRGCWKSVRIVREKYTEIKEEVVY